MQKQLKTGSVANKRWNTSEQSAKCDVLKVAELTQCNEYKISVEMNIQISLLSLSRNSH